jgi:hypothetical protein
MRRISIIFFTILILQVFSYNFHEGLDIFIEDNNKCSKLNVDFSQITASKCNEITPLLESKGFYKGECCKISGKWDPLYNLKKSYHENWKKMAIEIYEVDENISDDDLRAVVISEELEEPDDICGIVLDNQREASLYEMALITMNKTIKYDCGSGEQTFNARNYYPKNEKEEIDKDLVDCNNMNENYNEKKCFKQGNKLLSDNTQCCWCEYNLNPNLNMTRSQGCTGNRIDETKESFNKVKEMLLSIDPNANVKINCRCTNKKGEMINVKLDTVSDDIIIN